VADGQEAEHARRVSVPVLSSSVMVCPHCHVAFRTDWKKWTIEDRDGTHLISHTTCPECERLTLLHEVGSAGRDEYGNFIRLVKVDRHLIFNPLGGITRNPVPEEVPDDLRSDYVEAAIVQHLSPKASAALSRRCLQNTIRQRTGISKPTLDKEIDEVMASSLLPSELAGQLDAVRQIGNFAAHPMKSKVTGDILDVEPGEAEWNLDVLDGLFYYWYVQPAKAAARKAALNMRLKEAGKPELP
jgi:hypothetical protein